VHFFFRVKRTPRAILTPRGQRLDHQQARLVDGGASASGCAEAGPIIGCRDFSLI